MPLEVTPTTFLTNPNPENLFYQDWESSNPTLIFHQTTNAAFPAPISVPITIKDIVNSQGNSYNIKRLEVQKAFVGNSQVDWLDCEFLGHLLANSYAFDYELGMIENLNLTPKNIPQLAVGLYEIKILFIIKGRHSVLSPFVLLSQYEHFIKLYVSETSQVSWTPQTFNLTHIQNVPSPYKDIEVTGDNWELRTPANYVLSSPNSDVTITPVTSPLFGTYYKAEGYGTRIVRFSLGGFFDNPTALTLNPFSEVIQVKKADVLLGYVPFNVYVQENDGFVALPTNFDFQALKGVQEATPIELNIYTTFSYTYTKPVWLIMEVLAEYAPGIPSKFLVYPINSNNLSEGNYLDDITFNVDTGVGYELEVLSVNHNVYDTSIIPYSFSKMNFTKDVKFIEVFSQLNDTYFQLEIQATVFDFVSQSSNSKTFTVPLKALLYQNHQKQNIGLLIEKMLYKIIEPNTYISPQYNAAQVILTITEIKFNDNSVVSSFTTQIMKFLSGLTPSTIVHDCAILDINNDGPKRVTATSFAYLNLMLTPGTKIIKVLRHRQNSESVADYAINSSTDVYRENIQFSDYELRQGDVLEFKVIFEDETFLSKNYIVFPDGDYSNMILWEDEFRVLQSFEFTGKHTMKNDLTNITQNLYQNLVEVLEKVESTKEVSFVINTGFITKKDKRTIESICDAKRAWLYISDERKISIVPITKSLVISDSDEELIAYDLEFQINRKYNEENNSF